MSDFENNTQCCVTSIYCCLSDLLMTYCTRKFTQDTIGRQSTVEIRSEENYNDETFQRSAGLTRLKS